MIIDLYRSAIGTAPAPTFGRIVVGAYECETLERSDTLIDAGEYDLVEDWHHPVDLDHRYRVPELRGVPGRSDLQIHIANYAHELKGCIAPGVISADRTCVESSGDTFRELKRHIVYPCRIRIHDPL